MDSAKLYEGMFLFDSNIAARDWPGLENHVQDLLTKNGAELVYSERWPDRKLCYEIRGCKKGTYYLTYFKAPPGAIRPIRHDCELSERILRLLVLYDEELVGECEKRVRKEVHGSPEEIAELKEQAAKPPEAAATAVVGTEAGAAGLPAAQPQGGEAQAAGLGPVGAGAVGRGSAGEPEPALEDEAPSLDEKPKEVGEERT